MSGYQSSFEQPLLSFCKFSGSVSISWSALFELVDELDVSKLPKLDMSKANDYVPSKQLSSILIQIEQTMR